MYDFVFKVLLKIVDLDPSRAY